MQFQLRAPATAKTTHVGVMEFSSEEGRVFMPHWVMQNLGLDEGGMVVVKNVRLPKATFVKLRPHSKEFLDISNPRAV
jgi:ubiquitin fusion degradation protein 1